MQFEWDDEKAAANERDHRVSFDDATEVFYDELAVEVIDDRYEYDEDRWVVVGRAWDLVLFVVYTERGDVVRIISARRAEPKEINDYYKAIFG